MVMYCTGTIGLLWFGLARPRIIKRPALLQLDKDGIRFTHGSNSFSLNWDQIRGAHIGVQPDGALNLPIPENRSPLTDEQLSAVRTTTSIGRCTVAIHPKRGGDPKWIIGTGMTDARAMLALVTVLGERRLLVGPPEPKQATSAADATAR